MAQSAQPQVTFHSKRNGATRFDVFEELSPTAEAAVREFFRVLGAPEYVDEVVIPTLRIGESKVFCAVRDRPWPPWGLGGRTISAYCEVHEIAPDSYAVSPVHVAPQEAGNVALAAALFRELLATLAVSELAEVCYLAVEGSPLLDTTLRAAGFRRDEDVFLTEDARYFTYRAPVAEVVGALGLDRVSTVDLLTAELADDLLRANAAFHHPLQILGRVDARRLMRIPELIDLPRGGHASKPGGVPGGTGTGLVVFPRDRLLHVALGGFLGDRRERLTNEIVQRERGFRPATVLHEGDAEAVVDLEMRRAMTLDDTEFIAAEFVEQLKGALPGAIEKLGLEPFPVGEIELQVTASGDGDYYRLHRDRDPGSTRELSFVYFFHREPRAFSGGELRLFDRSAEGAHGHADDSQLVSPRQDTLVIFQSDRSHELLPVRVPSEEFADSRFTINGWIHRSER